MAANLFKRGDTYWWRAMIDGTTYRRSTGTKDFNLAKTKAREFDREVRSGQHRKRPMPTVGEWVLEYFAKHAKNRKGAEGRDPSVLRPMVVAWKDRRLDSIKPSDCEKLLGELLAGEDAPGTVRLRCIRFKLLFRLAIDDGLLTTNPWRGTMKLTPKVEARKRVLTREEEVRLKSALEPHWQRLITVALGTGLRRAELLNITPAHRQGGTLVIPGSMTKTGKGRIIPLRPEVIEALDAQLPVSSATPIASTPYWPYHPTTPADVLRKKAKGLGWQRLTLHDLRRTFGTRCADAGMPISHIQALMGHASIVVTSRHYLHSSDQTVADSLLKLEL